jgi:hypothetical protein
MSTAIGSKSMAAQTESNQSAFQDVFDSLRKTAEMNLKVQQEVLRQWTEHWPGFPKPQGEAWLEKVRKFQKEWAKTAKELIAKHREILDEQYELAAGSLEEAFRVAQASDPQEFAARCEAVCRKSLHVVREAGELQLKETQEALNKWISLAVKTAN